MIYPMMLKVDFASILSIRKRPRCLIITLVVNWLVKPFSMAFLGWLFFKHVFLPWIGPELADQYVAGVIILVTTAALPARGHGSWRVFHDACLKLAKGDASTRQEMDRFSQIGDTVIDSLAAYFREPHNPGWPSG